MRRCVLGGALNCLLDIDLLIPYGVNRIIIIIISSSPADSTLQYIKHISHADNNSGATPGTYYTTSKTLTFTVYLWTNALL